MTLDRAVAALEAEFGEQHAGFEPNERLVVSSGGEGRAGDSAPALYLMSAVAITAWQDAVAAMLRARKPKHWYVADGPHLDKWFMTAMDEKRTHRVAEERYSVTATIGLVTAA